MIQYLKSLISRAKCSLSGIKYVTGSTIHPYAKIGGGILLKGDVHISAHAKVNCDKEGRIILSRHSRLHPTCRIEAMSRSFVEIKESAMLSPGSVIFAHANSQIIIGNGTSISESTLVTAQHKVYIGEDVLMGPNVFIADYNHEYRDVTKPINHQGHVFTDRDNNPNEVNIGDGCWLGKNAVIVGNVTIGKNTVIGANSTVVKDIPAYSVAVGNPARVIKRYNFTTNRWERV